MTSTQHALRQVTGNIAMLVLLVLPVEAAESRFSDVRLMVSRHGISFIRNEGFEERRGVLVSDTAARRLRFEADGRALFDVSFDQLTAARYEQSRHPPRAFRRSAHYLTVHYVRGTGEPAFDIFRLPDAAPDLLAAFERDTGVAVDRSPESTSFMGLPVHLGPGTIVQVTGESGARVSGKVTQLSSAWIDLSPSRRLDAASIRQIDVKDPLWDGAALGAVAMMVPAFFVTFADCVNDRCSGFGMFSLHGWVVVGAGTAAGVAIDATRMRRVYRRMTAVLRFRGK